MTAPQKNQPLAWIVTLTAALFFFYEFIQMNFFNTINAELRQTFQLDAVAIGQLFSMYFYANFLCLFVAGNLLDRFSTKKILSFAVAICTAGTFLFTFSDQYLYAAIGRLMVGAGASFCFLSCIRLASRWFPPRRMAFVTGVVVTFAMLGGLIAQAPFSWLVSYLGDYHQAMLINSVLGVVIFLLVVIFVQDRPAHTIEAAHVQRSHLKAIGVRGAVKMAVCNPQNWLGGLYTALMNLPVFVIGGLWGVLYLTGTHQFTQQQASYATTIFFVGVIFGSLIYGYFSDRIQRRVLPMTVGALLSLVCMLYLMYAPHLTFPTTLLLFFLIGLVTSSQVLTYPLIAELNPLFLTSTAVSIDSLTIMASGFLVPPFFGWLLQHHAGTQFVNGVAVYTAQQFHSAMLILPIAFFISLILTLFMQESHCRQTG